MYLSQATSTAIIRCSREYYRIVWAALTLFTRLPQAEKSDKAVPVVVQVVRVSGTIRKAEEEAVRRARRMMARARQEEKDIKAGGTLLDDIFGGDEGKEREDMYQGIQSEGDDGESD